MKKQNGMTLISWSAAMVAGGFIVLLILKMAPVYLNNYKIRSSVNAVHAMSEISNMSDNEIRTALQKRFDVGFISGVDLNKDVRVIKQGDYVNVEIEYEVTESIVGNVSVLMYFKEGFESGSPN